MDEFPAAVQVAELGISCVAKPDRRQVSNRRPVARAGGRRLADQPRSTPPAPRSELTAFSAAHRIPRVFGRCRL
jgi:hypothetical protein